MNQVEIVTPKKLIVGSDCFASWIDEAMQASVKKVLVLSVGPIWPMLESSLQAAADKGLKIKKLDYTLPGEPTTDYFDVLRKDASAFAPDLVLGVGGGSVLDVAKLLSALCNRRKSVDKCFGKGLVDKRDILLYCAPTTAGTGSEVSPNAILLDSKDGEKKGIISPFLLPDCTLIDPVFTMSLPAKITAETGMDALCHCIEAYINVHAHPFVDTYALRGIGLVCKNLLKACRDGRNKHARESLALASMLGGLCLGPVNTCGVHALSYGLAGKYHMSHGLANALLLPEVLRFNKPACLARFGAMAKEIGLPYRMDNQQNADAVIDYIQQLSAQCGIPQHLSEIGINKEDIPEMADMAMNVTRLLSNNPREITREDVINIYENIY